MKKIFTLLFLTLILFSGCNKNDVAVIEMPMGTVEIELYRDVAPKTVDNFIKLVNDKFYEGTFFHRVECENLVQGGDPETKTRNEPPYGFGDPGYKIKAEFNDMKHEKGIVAMARSQHPDSAGSQFYVTLRERPSLDKKYTIFGKVVDGIEVIEKMACLDKDNYDLLREKTTIKKAYMK